MTFTLDDPDRLAPTSQLANTHRFNRQTMVSEETIAARGWMRNAAGEFLHFSGTCVATDKAYRWTGDAKQARAMRAASDFAKPFNVLVPIPAK